MKKTECLGLGYSLFCAYHFILITDSLKLKSHRHANVLVTSADNSIGVRLIKTATKTKS